MQAPRCRIYGKKHHLAITRNNEMTYALLNDFKMHLHSSMILPDNGYDCNCYTYTHCEINRSGKFSHITVFVSNHFQSYKEGIMITPVWGHYVHILWGVAPIIDPSRCITKRMTLSRLISLDIIFYHICSLLDFQSFGFQQVSCIYFVNNLLLVT